MSASIIDYTSNSPGGYTLHGPEVDGKLAIYMDSEGNMSLDRYTDDGVSGQWDYSYYSDSAYDGNYASKGTGFIISDGTNSYTYEFGDYWTGDTISDANGLVASESDGTLIAFIELPDLPGVFFQQTVKYSDANSYYTIFFSFVNTTTTNFDINLVHGGDTYLYRSDDAQGYGILDDNSIITDEADAASATVIGVGGRKMDPAAAGGDTATPVDGTSAEVTMFMVSTSPYLTGYNTGYYGSPDSDWTDDGLLNGSQDSDGWIDPTMRDHGYGLQWQFALDANATSSVNLVEAFVLGPISDLAVILDAAATEAETSVPPTPVLPEPPTPDARSAELNNEVFLGGNYIEVGVRNVGSYGTDGNIPSNFYGNPDNSNLGLTSDADGFGQGLDLRLDYFMPGSPSEGFAWGYTLDGTAVGNNYSNTSRGNNNITGITNNDLSVTADGYLSAETVYTVIDGQSNPVLEVTSVIYFYADWSYFWTEVTATNVSGADLTDVRFVRAFDPDNDVFYVGGGGDYTTANEITALYDENGYSAVQASSTGSAYIADAGKPAVILFYSEDSRAKTSIGSTDFGVRDAYSSDLHDNLADNNERTMTDDVGISISKEVMTLANGGRFTFKYLTALGGLTAHDIAEQVGTVEEAAPETVKIVEGASVRPGTLSSFGNGAGAPKEMKVESAGDSSANLTDGPSPTMVDVLFSDVGDQVIYAQFTNGLSGYIGAASELISPSEMIDLSRWSEVFKGQDAGRAHQSFVMDSLSTTAVLNEIGAENDIRFLYAGDFEVNGGDGRPMVFSLNNTVTEGVTDVINISRPGTEQIALDLDGFTGMAIVGAGVDVIGSSENNYVITDGSGTVEMGNGRDVIVLNDMNAIIDGGKDLDVARIYGNSFSVNVTENGGILYVTNGMGTTLITDVEIIVLDNGFYKKDLASGSWQWINEPAKNLDAAALIGIQGTEVLL